MTPPPIHAAPPDRPGRATEPRRPVLDDRRAGRLMIGIAIVGVFVAIVGTIGAWHLVGQIDDTSRDTLDVTIETIDSVESSIDLADEVLDAASETIITAGSTLEAVVGSFDESSGVIASIDDLMDIVGPSLNDAASTLRTLEGVGDGIDDVLVDLSSIPFGPDYDETDGLGPTIGSLADNVEALPIEFEQTSTELDGFAESLEELSSEVSQLSSDIVDVTAQLEGRDDVVAQYRNNIAEARAVATATRDDLGGDIGLTRLIIVIGGVNFGLGQIVPLWYGRQLIGRARSAVGEGGIA